MKRTLQLVMLAGAALAASAQAPAPEKKGEVAFHGSLRSRLEIWDWFQGQGNNDYAFLGNLLRFGWEQSLSRREWKIEFAAPVLVGLPDDANAPAPQGDLGMGATYYAANNRNRNAAMVFPKQAYVRFNSGGGKGQSLLVGRYEFSDGAEFASKNPTLTVLKNTRIREKLIGPFGFTHVMRSFDGFHYGYDAAAGRFTLLGGVTTRGAFQTDGWGWTNTGIGYASWTQPVAAGESVGELRLFGIYYQDWRPIAKIDNRPQAVRRGDLGNLRIGTFGGHYIHAAPTQAGTFDFLAWGVGQTGRWSTLDHNAWSFALEGGYQPPGPKALKPWLRAGYSRSSGDDNPNDQEHRTFFQILPTARIHARFPFYNQMNLESMFGEIVLRPTPKVLVRGDVHGLRLSERADLWYSGGGAFSPWAFGFVGRPSQGGRGLATLYDLSIDFNPSPALTVTGYYGYANGKSVMAAIYPTGKNAQYAYLEMIYRF